MTYLNRYKPTSAPRESYRDAHLHTPVGEYDLNWAHGEISVLSTGQLQLRPFIPSLHAEAFLQGLQDPLIQKQDLFNLKDLGDVLHFLEAIVRRDPNTILFAVYVHQSRISNAPSWSCDSDWIFSGWVSLFGTSSYSLQAEFGISLFAHARGLGISKPATALVIKWLLDDKSKGGLMFRKFVYCANSENKSSQALAKSVGVKEEGVLRCDGIAERVKDGKGGRQGDGRWPNSSLDKWIGGITYEDWVNGGREHVDAILSRW